MSLGRAPMVEGTTLAGLAQGHRSFTRLRGDVDCTSRARGATSGSRGYPQLL